MRHLLPTLLLCAATAAACSGGDGGPDAAPPAPSLELVGHTDLGARGMNSALAVVGNHVYVGSRTDGVTHQNAGVLIVDVSDPAAPTVVGSIEAPDEALIGMSSRELRAIPEANLLLVLNLACSPQIHGCGSDPALVMTGGIAETENFKFYDISDPVNPVLVGRYDFGLPTSYVRPHEFFLWIDPVHAGRRLLYVSTPLGPPSLTVLDVSDPAAVTVAGSWDAYNDAMLDEVRDGNSILHSLSVSDDGRTAYLAHLGAGFLMVDTADLADALPAPAIRLITPIAQRLDLTPPNPPGTHSALAIPGRPLVLLTDEVYPIPVQVGCPWGWARLVDVADPTRPTVVSEYKVAENDPALCAADRGPTAVAYTAHNATVTANLALISWHSAGLHVVDTSDAAAPAQLTVFMPQPLAAVATEDPGLGGNPVTMWSYPVVKDGLIYVVDIRNGLYVLRYHGPHEGELAVPFLEGNSNRR